MTGGIEIHFMHYSSVQEAADKWARRLSRVKWGKTKILYKFCDHDGATDQQIQTFDSMESPNRVCFTGKSVPATKHTVVIESHLNKRVVDGGELAKISGKYFSAVEWICGGNAVDPLWPRNIL